MRPCHPGEGESPPVPSGPVWPDSWLWYIVGTQGKPVEWKRTKLNFIFPISISFTWLLLFPSNLASWLTFSTQALSTPTSISYIPRYLLPRTPFPLLHLDKFQARFQRSMESLLLRDRTSLQNREAPCQTFGVQTLLSAYQNTFSLPRCTGHTSMSHSSNKCYTSLYSPNS